ncbi:hypothetical protein PVAG01_10103 [Phlyctema vagabunda]|uniref:DUF4105 domain-containing protein n=1 Tax=Phlyctema vagabunda TaxID=108571 RepID=A0ABR4P5C9_9HELO
MNQAPDTEPSFPNRWDGRPANIAILYPRYQDHFPTIGDLPYKDKNLPSRILDRIVNPILPNVDILRTAMGPNQFENSLPDASPSAHDVYLVCRPHRLVMASFAHWSYYSQGHFYHLSAPGLRGPSQGFSDGQEAANVVLKHQDFSSPDTPDYLQLLSWSKKKVLVAFQVGQTEYDPEALQLLAGWIVDQISRYEIYENNCQRFVTSLFNRTIMRKRDISTFVGTIPQILHWDQEAKRTGTHTDSVEHGFLVQEPHSGAIHYSDMLESSNTRTGPLKMSMYLQDIFKQGRSKDIRVLIEQGDLALSAYGALAQHNEILKASVTNIRRAFTEFGEDILAARWRDAFVGRLDTRQDFIAHNLARTQRGDQFARFTNWTIKPGPDPVTSTMV